MSLRFQMLLTTSLFNDVYHVIHFTLKAPRLLTWLKNMKCGRLELRKILINTLIFIFYLSTLFFFFLSGFSFTDTDNSQDSRGRKGIFIYSTLLYCSSHILWKSAFRNFAQSKILFNYANVKSFAIFVFNTSQLKSNTDWINIQYVTWLHKKYFLKVIIQERIYKCVSHF